MQLELDRIQDTKPAKLDAAREGPVRSQGS